MVRFEPGTLFQLAGYVFPENPHVSCLSRMSRRYHPQELFMLFNANINLRQSHKKKLPPNACNHRTVFYRSE